MKFTANGQHYEFDESRIMFAEARAIEGATGLTMKELGVEMNRGSATALQALMWIAVKRAEPATRFSDLDEWDIGSIDFDGADVAAEDEADPFDGPSTDGEQP